MSRVIRYAKRGFAALAVLVVLLVAGVEIVVHTSWGQGLVRDFVGRTLRESYNLDVELGEFDLSFIPPSVTVRDVALQGADGQPFVATPSVHAAVDGGALLRGKLVIDRVHIEEPRVRLVIAGGKVANLPPFRSDGSSEKSSESGGSDFWLRAAKIAGGEVELELHELLPGDPLLAKVSGIDLDVTGPASGSYDLKLHVAGGDLRQGSTRLELHELSSTASITPEQVRVKAAKIHLGELRGAVTDGELELSGEYDARAGAEVRLPLAMVGDLPFETPPLGGDLSLSATLERRDGELSVRGGLRVASLALALERRQEASAAVAEGAGDELTPLGDLDAQLAFDNGTLTASRLRLELAGGEPRGLINLDGTGIGLTESRLPIDGNAVIAGADVGEILATIGVADPGVDLGLNGSLAVSGSLNPLALRVEAEPLELRHIKFADRGAEGDAPGLEGLRIAGVVVVGPESAQVERLDVAIGADPAAPPALRVTGRFPYSDSALRARVESLGGVSLAELAPLAGTALGGRARIDAEITGTYSDLIAAGNVEVDGLLASGYRIDRVRSEVRYRDKVLSLPSGQARLGASRIGIRNGRVDLGAKGGPQVLAGVKLDPVELDDLMVLLDVKGPAGNFHGALRGEADLQYRHASKAITAGVKGSIPELRWDEAELGEVELDASFEGGRLVVRRAEVRDGSGVVAATGNMGRGGELDFQVRVERYQLAPMRLKGLLPPGVEVASVIDARASITGTRSEPLAKGRLALTRTQLAGKRLEPTNLGVELDASGLHVTGSIAGNVVRVTSLDLGLDAPRPFRARGRLAAPDIKRLVPADMLPESLAGGATGVFDVEGNADDLGSLVGRVAFDSFRFEHSGVAVRNREPLELVLVDGYLRSRRALLDVVDAAAAPDAPGGATVRVAGLRLGLVAPYSLRARAAVELQNLERVIGAKRAPDGMDVTAQANLGVTGNLNKLADLRGRGSVRRLDVRRSSLQMTLDEPLSLTFADERVNLVPARFLFSSGPTQRSALDVGGWVSTSAMNVDIDGRLELAILAPLIEPVERLSGGLVIDCRVTGEPRSPRLSGFAAVSDVRAMVKGLPGQVTDGVGRVTFQGDAIFIDGLRARVLGGDAKVTGEVGLADLGVGPYHLDVRLADARYRIGPESSVVFDADIDVASPRADEKLPLVSGRVDVARLRYREPYRIKLGVGSVMDRRVERAAVRTFDAAAAAVRLDIILAQVGDMVLDNNVVQGKVHIERGAQDFRVVGTNVAPGLLGMVRMEPRSTVTFQHNEFLVERGLLHFHSRDQIVAGINFVASAQIRDWDISLHVRGTTEDPEIHLTSDPPLDEFDIALLLTIGMTQAEAMQTQAPIVSKIINQGIDSVVREALPFFDNLRLTTEYSSEAGRAVPQAHVSRELTKNLEIGATVDLTESSDIEANLDWQFHRLFSLEAVYASDPASSIGEIGGDIILRSRW